jgi:dihydroorotase/N-acyl-D-amino-acid deacylase
VKETIAIGEQGGVPTQVSHHKVIGKSNWGRSVETLKLIDDARARGVDATIDQYPYTASSTTIHAALMPAWALEGGHAETVKRLADPATRAKIRAATANLIQNERGGGDPRNVAIALCEWNPSLAGKNWRRSRKRAGSSQRSRMRRRPRCGWWARAAAAASFTPWTSRTCSASLRIQRR